MEVYTMLNQLLKMLKDRQNDYVIENSHTQVEEGGLEPGDNIWPSNFGIFALGLVDNEHNI